MHLWLSRFQGVHFLPISSCSIVSRSFPSLGNKVFSTSLISIRFHHTHPPSLLDVDATTVNPTDFTFQRRHIGPSRQDQFQMLATLSCDSFQALLKRTFPTDLVHALNLSPTSTPFASLLNEVAPLSEPDLLHHLHSLAMKNNVPKAQFLGQGFYGTHIPTVIQRNVFENPGWYTSYSPYQPEISQGRLTSLFNYQTMVSELTGFPLANASLLDEGSAAAEALMLCARLTPTTTNSSSSSTSNSNAKLNSKKMVFFVDQHVFLHTKACLQMRAEGIGIQLVHGDIQKFCSNDNLKEFKDKLIGVMVQYPSSQGHLPTDLAWIKTLKTFFPTTSICCATDLLALTLLKPPAELNIDICFGNSQRFGVPLGLGGPHAAFFACRQEYQRKLPGRLVGLSQDRLGQLSFRLALQTREQHIRREKATSNICTAQALLANLSAMYAVYHGPEGLLNIAHRVHHFTHTLATHLKALGYTLLHSTFFDTLTLQLESKQVMQQLFHLAEQESLLPGYPIDSTHLSISLDETHTKKHIQMLINLFAQLRQQPVPPNPLDLLSPSSSSSSSPSTIESFTLSIPPFLRRTTPFMQQSVFHAYRSETEMLRYIKQLETMDLSLCHAMIPLGSCTMKLNATTELLPLSWPSFSNLHPYTPSKYIQGYLELIRDLESMLMQVTGMDRVSFQPNSGAQGEYTGLRVIQAYLESQGEGHRNLCLIPTSAHGTNPASAVLAGLKVQSIPCNNQGKIKVEEMKQIIHTYAKDIACIMITYPSTFGIMDQGLPQLIQLIHEVGGQVYLDGGNFNALVGHVQPGHLGVDVCHLNLHKTFCIPHGGGGPGAGPIAVRSHLIPFLPSHPHLFSCTHSVSSSSSSSSSLSPTAPNPHALGPITSSPFGSALLYPIPYSYMKLMGWKGLRRATEVAILNANYLLHHLQPYYKTIPFSSSSSSTSCAHEFLIDVQPFHHLNVRAMDIAKRLLDYNFHAPTLAWPVSHALMIEPTESESKKELDRFLQALIHIRQEIECIENGTWSKHDNPLINAPHPLSVCLSSTWTHPYSRETAAFPVPDLRVRKCWPTRARIDDVFGDTNLVFKLSE